MKLIVKFQIVFIAVISSVCAYEYVYKNSPSHQGNYNGEPVRKRPVLRSSFGGESFHGSARNIESNTVPHGRKNSVRDGHAFGAHSGEYFNKESNYWLHESERRRDNNR